MFRIIEAATANELWCRARVAMLDESMPQQNSRFGVTREILHVAMSIANPRQRWVTARVPAINVAFALAEVVWIVAGRRDLALLKYFNQEFPRYVGEEPMVHGAYGHRLRRHLGIDQLKRAFCALENNPNSRQIVLQIWDAASDLPSENGSPRAADIPCNIVALLKLRNGALDWTQIMRSNDIFRGLPYNVVQFTCLQEIMSGWLGVRLGNYHQMSDSLHLYDSDFDKLSKVADGQVPESTDELTLKFDDSEATFAELSQQADMIAKPNVTTSELVASLRSSRLPEPYKNILCVLIAEGARRRGDAAAALDIVGRCSNPVYHLMFTKWHARVQSNQKGNTDKASG